MCAIGRGIMSRPTLLMIDELSLGLAPRAIEQLTESLPLINRSGVAILLVEQDVLMAFELSKRAFVLESGRIALSGKTTELLENPTFHNAYVGIVDAG